MKMPKFKMPDLEEAKKFSASVTKKLQDTGESVVKETKKAATTAGTTLQHAGESVVEASKKAATTAGTTLQHAGESVVEVTKKAATQTGKTLRNAGEKVAHPFKNPISLNPAAHLRGYAELKFTEERLPFLFVGTVNYTYCDNNVKVYLQQGATPEVAAIYGSDDPNDIRITRNDLLLPDELLRHIYSMARHRAIIASTEERGFDPSKKDRKTKRSLWDDYNEDKKSVLREWEKVKVEYLKKIGDYQNPLK